MHLLNRFNIRQYFQEEEIWKSPSSQDDIPSTSGINLNSSNYLEHTPSSQINKITNVKWQDLPSMLASLGLAKYVGLFIANEIDLTTFPTLTDQDLVDIGVTALGARRKMLLMISGEYKMFVSMKKLNLVVIQCTGCLLYNKLISSRTDLKQFFWAGGIRSLFSRLELQ